MKVQMTRPEMHSIAGLNRREIRQDAVLELKRFDRTGVHRIIVRCVVAARYQDDLLVVGRRPDLMRIFAGIERVRLIHPFADRAILIEAMHGERAWIVISREQILALQVHARVDRT